MKRPADQLNRPVRTRRKAPIPKGEEPGPSRKSRTGLRILLWSSLVLVILLVGGVTAGWLTASASLAQLDGHASLPGLSAAVVVERDDLGVPTIRAANRVDAARATGFLHAQDRLFQMDLFRRMAAGELAALLGSAMLETDRNFRRHGLRAVARRVVEMLPEPHRKLLDAYAAGVNSGYQALAARPPEYLVLRTVPETWLPEDSVLAAYTMFLFLQDENAEQDAALGVLREVVPPNAFDFFVPIGTEWDAPIDGSVFKPVPIPTPEEFTFDRLLRTHVSRSGSKERARPAVRDLALVGSNSFAVDGRVSRTGAALVANDMHLLLQIPNTWYRVRIICQSLTAREPNLDITGVTLPSTPAVVVGSNTDIAWAFTNSGLDTSDLILLEISSDNPRLYKTPQGWKEFEERREVLKVWEGQDEELVVDTTIWGPVVQGTSTPRAIRWAAHSPEVANFNLIDLEQVRDVETALRLAPSMGIPVQNFVVGDWQGRIGWTLAGRFPRRSGFNGMLPISWANGSARWDGWFPPAEYPRVSSPASGRIWTANNRIAGSAAYLQAGPWVTDIGARAKQIRDDLAPLEEASPADMLAIQLDDRAVFLERWRTLLLNTLGSLKPESNDDEKQKVRSVVENWGARATVDSAGYRLVRGFRETVLELLLEPIIEACRTIEPDFYYPTPQVEEPAWTLLNSRPLHLLNRKFKTYDELLMAGLDHLLTDLRKQGLRPEEATWGKRNMVAIEHPLSRSIPLIGRWLDMPSLPLPGDSGMPRVQHRKHGASQRLAVSPGHEDQGIFHMPGGQSGHFLSPFYRAGHDAWVEGKPTPFLPGPTRHKLLLQ